MIRTHCHSYRMRQRSWSRRREWMRIMFSLLIILPVNGQNQGIHEIDFSNIGGVAGASSEWSPNPTACGAINAFIKNDLHWCDDWPDVTDPQVIWYNFLEPITVTKFAFKGPDNGESATMGPSSYQFFGSNLDGQCDREESWTLLFEDDSDTPFADDDDIKAEEICNPSKYICYGFKILKTPHGAIRMKDIRFYTRGDVSYIPKRLFQVSYPDTLAPMRRGAPTCPTHNTFGCYRPDEMLEIYSEVSLPENQIESRFTYSNKPCECKCLCLDDPLCQAVTIIKSMNLAEGHRCLFTSNNAVLDGTTLQPELRAVSYMKRGCDGVNCTLNSICEDGGGTKAAVCGCMGSYKSNGYGCVNQ